MSAFHQVLLGLTILLSVPASFAILLAQQQQHYRQQSHQLLADALLSRTEQPAQTCASLADMGTYSAVNIGVGSPPQFFSVVADTGSDNVVIPSCFCQQIGQCSSKDACYTGSGQSSTFSLASSSGGNITTASGYDLGKAVVAGQLEVVTLTYGSGPIQAVIASDFVQVGSIRTMMPDGILMMIGQELSMQGPFDGILGLGIPAMAPAVAGSAADGNDTMPLPPGFLEQSGVARFSVCFNDGSDGVLRLGVPANPNAMGSVGQAHWGLGFYGISVGVDSPQNVQFCTPGDMQQGQQTPCGAIPDSGTTVLMGPQDHVAALFESICAQWPRCQAAAANSDQDSTTVFMSVLYNCSAWMGDQGLDELPTIYFHVAGSDGRQQSLSMTGAGYVFQVQEPQVMTVTKYLMGLFPITVNVPTGQEITVCSPAFGVMEYDTEQNGPVWILGMPLFYDYQVVYDLKTSPPSVAFDSLPCGSCAASPSASLLAENDRRERRRQPRRISGELRVPRLDTTRPL